MKAFRSVLLFAASVEAATCLFSRQNIFINGSLDWTSAQTYCRNNHVDLLTISKQVKNFNCVDQQCWIGLSKNPQETAFTRWSDGSILNFTAWKQGEPSDLEVSHCVALIKTTWTAHSCTEPLKFLCYEWVPRLIMVEEMMNWEEALEYCRINYSDLVSLSTDEDLAVVNLMIMKSQTIKVWTGLRFMAGQWFWVNQEPVQKLASLPSCPIKPFHCGALEAGGVLENRDCSEKRNFLCYQK